MALHPIVHTEKVARSFLRYQLTAYAFADERLHAQMRPLLFADLAILTALGLWHELERASPTP